MLDFFFHLEVSSYTKFTTICFKIIFLKNKKVVQFQKLVKIQFVFFLREITVQNGIVS